MTGGRLHDGERVRVITDLVGQDLGHTGTVTATDSDFSSILVDGDQPGEERIFARYELAPVSAPEGKE